MSLEIVLGEFYTRRDGVTVRIARKMDAGTSSFTSDLGDYYFSDGKYVRGFDHPKDLVSKWMDKEASSLAKMLKPEPIPNILPDPVQTPTPAPGAHKHAAVIKAWADGAKVEYKGPGMTEWKEIRAAGESYVVWNDNVEYRIKPGTQTVTLYAALYHIMRDGPTRDPEFVVSGSYQSKSIPQNMVSNGRGLAVIEFNVDTSNGQIQSISWTNK